MSVELLELIPRKNAAPAIWAFDMIVDTEKEVLVMNERSITPCLRDLSTSS